LSFMERGLIVTKLAGEAEGDGGPGEIVLVGGLAAGGQFGAEVRVGEEFCEGFVELGGLVWRDEEYAGFGDGRGGFRAGEGDDREACGDSGDGATATGGNRAANEEQNVAGGEFLDDLFGIDEAFDGEVGRGAAKAFAEGGFAEFGVTAEEREMQATEFLRGIANGGEDEFGFANAGIAAGDAEDADGWNNVLRRAQGGFGRNGKIGADGNERRLRRKVGWRPRQILGRDGEDGEIGLGEGASHGASLGELAKRIDETRAGIRLGVVIDDADVGTSRFENVENAEKFLWETARGPRESGVLNEDPGIAPLRGHELEDIERFGPAVNFPGDAANFHLHVVGLESGGEIAAVFFDGVSGLVCFSQQGDDGKSHSE
jgi:hypothetical protein